MYLTSQNIGTDINIRQIETEYRKCEQGLLELDGSKEFVINNTPTQ